ncbi:hypothetical protein Hanom_Chr05g00436681 [Helianthus anomalus]
MNNNPIYMICNIRGGISWQNGSESGNRSKVVLFNRSSKWAGSEPFLYFIND